MRNINHELSFLNPKKLSIEQSNKMALERIRKSKYPVVYCPECGDRIINDNGIISQHMRNKHIRDRKNNESRGYKFHPTN